MIWLSDWRRDWRYRKTEAVPRLAIYWQLDGFILDFLKNKDAGP